MIGGRRTKKKAVGEKASSLLQFAIFWFDMRLSIRPIRPPKKTIAMLSGKYWKFFCSMKWISKMPNANTHNTKKIAIELLCSSSAEPLSGNTGSPGEVVVEVMFVVFVAGSTVVDAIKLGSTDTDSIVVLTIFFSSSVPDLLSFVLLILASSLDRFCITDL
jgi:hypothetical protein